ncbi:MAG: heme-binding protein, partial [Verrucomicrobiales bacterium]|nr:heme-binding protein [Verrucomicrobiales bacterium]
QLKKDEAGKKLLPAQTGNPGTKWDLMDVGPFFSSSLSAGPASTYKGISIKLGLHKEAAVCFDTELLRMSIGWTDGFLQLPSGRNGLEGIPQPVGSTAFFNSIQPGWGKNGSFADPRPKFHGTVYGPLPKDWAHYKGLYRSGTNVILSYSVGTSQVLEMPGFERRNGLPVFTRIIQIDHSAEPMWLQVCESPEAKATSRADLPVLTTQIGTNSYFTAAATIGAPVDAAWELRDVGGVRLKLPPFNHPIVFKVLICSNEMVNLTNAIQTLKERTPLPHLEKLIVGGPARYEPLFTNGTIGTESGPYQIDEIKLPTDNPWKSWVRPSGFDFFADGRAAVCSLSGDVWIVSGLDKTFGKISWKRFATGLFQPLGLKIIKDTVYVICRDQIVRLIDLNGDDEADFYENFNNEISTGGHYHEFCLDLQTDSQGNFWTVKASNLGMMSQPPQGTLVRVSKDGAEMRIGATGLRVANGICIGPRDEITVSDNEGNWIPSSRINRIQLGGFYGYVGSSYSKTEPTNYAAPICWIPHSVDNSSAEEIWISSDKWGPLTNHLLHTSYGTCSLFHLMTQESNGQIQGGVVKFPLKFNTGIMRGRFNPIDGQLYLCGLSGWDTRATKEGGLYRVRYTGKALNMPKDLQVRHDGIEITFTDPLDITSAMDEQNFSIEQWNYKWEGNYGSSDYSTKDGNTIGHDEVKIQSVKLSADHKVVSLFLPDLKPVMQMKIKYHLKALDGTELSQEIYNTINFVPEK